MAVASQVRRHWASRPNGAQTLLLRRAMRRSRPLPRTARTLLGMEEAAYELPAAGADPLSRLASAAERDEITFLVRGGRSVAAVVPVDVAIAGAAAVQALEDAADAGAIRDAASGMPQMPHDDLMTELGFPEHRVDRS
jgi:hypothetical protein